MMKNLITFVSLVAYSLISAQQLKQINFSNENLQESEIEISQNWKSSINAKTLTIYNGSIANVSDKNVKSLNLEYYLASSDSDLSTEKFEGFLLAKTPLGTIKKKSSMAGISIENSIDKNIPDGMYYPILVLSDGQNEIINVVQLSEFIKIQNGRLTKKNDDKSMSKANMAALTDLNKPIKLNVSSDDSISFEEEWEISIDFKNFMVNLVGGDIANNTFEDTKNLVVDVYLTEGKQTLANDFEGIHIAKAAIDPIQKAKKFAGTSIKTNLRAIVPQGTYHILMTVSEVDDAGKAVVKSSKSFKNPISL